MFLSGIYILSPVDLIPEGNGSIFSLKMSTYCSVYDSNSSSLFAGFLGIIGLLDDLIIMFICFLHVAALYRSVLLFRHGGS